MLEGIKTQNIKPIVRKRVERYIEELKKKDEVEGIVLLSGLANTEYKDFIDEFSDIDIGIFLNVDREHLPEWLQPFSFYIVVTDQNGDDKVMEVNLHQKIYSEEVNSNWGDHKKEFYKYASEVVFDRNGKIEKLINEKTIFTEEYRKLLLSHLLSRIYWNVIVNPTNAIKRGFLYNGEDLLNQGLSCVLDLLFVYNKMIPPAAKWKVSMLNKLKYLPKDIEKRVEECFVIKEVSEADIMRRRTALLSISKEIEEKIYEEGVFDREDDYCEYEYKYWTAQQKQLKIETPYDNITNQFSTLSYNERKILRGLLCEYFIMDNEDIYKIPQDCLNETQRKLLQKII